MACLTCAPSEARAHSGGMIKGLRALTTIGLNHLVKICIKIKSKSQLVGTILCFISERNHQHNYTFIIHPSETEYAELEDENMKERMKEKIQLNV